MKTASIKRKVGGTRNRRGMIGKGGTRNSKGMIGKGGNRKRDPVMNGNQCGGSMRVSENGMSVNDTKMSAMSGT